MRKLGLYSIGLKGIILFVIGLMCLKAHALPLCSMVLKGSVISNVEWTPYTENQIPKPYTIEDPYLQFAYSSDQFREFLLSSYSEESAFNDYKNFVDAVPRFTDPVWDSQDKAPYEMSFSELLNYIFTNYDFKTRTDLDAELTYKDGPLSHPLSDQIWAGLNGSDKNYLPIHVLKMLNSIHLGWSDLLRKSPETTNPKASTLLYLPNPYIVAGGRFRETYYWDSYWIMKGLIESGYKSTALGMLENFIFMIERYGLIANGNRYYYLTRTQVPLIVEMVKLFEKERMLNFSQNQKGFTFEKRILKALDRYYSNVWKGTERYNRDYGLFRYSDGAGGEKRPESLFIRPEASAREPRSAEYHSQRVFAESGWDMSYSRFGNNPQNWFPADLNALMISYTESLSLWFAKDGDLEKAHHYKKESRRTKKSFDKYLFDPDLKLYVDYNFVMKKRSQVLTAASYFSFWLFDSTKKQDETKETLHAIIRLTEVLKPEGSLGVHSTSEDGKGQWDGSWTWANLNEVAFQAFKRHGLNFLADRLALDYSFMLGKVFHGEGEGQFFEKYDARSGRIKLPEETEIYGNEIGFGWTNATASIFLRHLYSRGLLKKLDERIKNDSK